MLLLPPPQEHPGGGRIVGRPLEQPTRDRAEPVRHFLRSELADQASPPLLRVPVHLVEQVFLAAEMAIDRAFGHPRPGRDRGGSGSTEADGGVEIECCAQQPLTGSLTIAA